MNNQEIKQDLTIIPGAKQICTKKTGLNNRFKQMEEKVIVYRLPSHSFSWRWTKDFVNKNDKNDQCSTKKFTNFSSSNIYKVNNMSKICNIPGSIEKSRINMKIIIAKWHYKAHKKKASVSESLCCILSMKYNVNQKKGEAC